MVVLFILVVYGLYTDDIPRVSVPDKRFEWLCDHYKPASKVPGHLEVVDIAGLVRGAASGAGLGNAFLSHISAVDGIYHVVRIFDSAEVTHVEVLCCIFFLL